MLVGTYTALNHRYDAPAPSRWKPIAASRSVANLNIQAQTSYTDSFSLGTLCGAYWGR